MLPDKLKLEIATPDHLVLTEGVDEVVLPSVDGSMGVRPGHAPVLARLDVGEISYRIGSDVEFLACSGGFAEVLPDRVSILAETAERAEEIDIERAQRSLERAEGRMKAAKEADAGFRRAEVSLKRALCRIEVRGHRGN